MAEDTEHLLSNGVRILNIVSAPIIKIKSYLNDIAKQKYLIVGPTLVLVNSLTFSNDRRVKW